MSRSTLEWLLIVGGCLHFVVLIASANVPRMLNWRGELAKLAPMLRRLFWVYGAFLVLTIVGFGAITLAAYGELAGQSPLARWFCGLVALFWTARVGVALLVFDVKPYLTTPMMRIGYHGLNGCFVVMAAIYAAAAVMR